MYELCTFTMEGRPTKYIIKKDNLLYPELSFKVNGILFDVYNKLGGGHAEKYYEKAVAIALKNSNVLFSEQHHVPIRFQGQKIGSYFLDFLIEEKIVLELKRGRYIPLSVINQTKQYLESLNMKLAIIGCFAHDCVVIKRIVNHAFVN